MSKRASKSKLPAGLRRKLRYAVATLALLAASQLAITFVPYDRVPERAQPYYRQLLTLRNQLVRRTGLPIRLYDDAAHVVDGALDAQVFFAPSPTIDDRLAELIDSAASSVQCAVYDLDLTNVVDALVRAHQRDVQVRVIVDTDNLELSELTPLRQAGVPLVGDGREAIMHHKFVVIDRQRVWTGSYNFTRNGTTLNDNNALLLAAPRLAVNYSIEFDEMWDGQFGPGSPATTIWPNVQFDDVRVRTFFAPEDRVMDTVVRTVRQAESRIDLMAFSFTHPELAEAIAERAAAGVVVRCLFDPGQAENAYSQDKRLAGAGIVVRLSANRRGAMHHKVILIDGRTTVTGSFNFSRNADTTNDENLLIIDSPALTAIFAEEFRRCWEGTKGY